MANLQQLGVTFPILNKDMTPDRDFRAWVRMVYELIPKSGSGSPEGVVDGVQGATYYDMSASAGNRIYIKTSDDISGDVTKGWEKQ